MLVERRRLVADWQVFCGLCGLTQQYALKNRSVVSGVLRRVRPRCTEFDTTQRYVVEHHRPPASCAVCAL